MTHLIAIAIIAAPICIWLMRRCRHKFTLIRTVRVRDDDGRCVQFEYISICDHCGRVRVTKDE